MLPNPETQAMNTRHIRIVAAAAAALFVASVSLAEGFVRPIIGIADPSIEGYSSATTIGICGGYYWAGSESSITKEASLELGYTKWTYNESVMGYNMHASEKYLPIMVNLRAHFALPGGLKNVRWYIGPSGGIAQSRGSIRLSGGEIGTYSVSATDWTFCFGGTTGFVFQVSPRFDIDLGFRLLRLQGPDFEIEGESIEIDDSTTKIWYAGIGYRF